MGSSLPHNQDVRKYKDICSTTPTSSVAQLGHKINSGNIPFFFGGLNKCKYYTVSKQSNALPVYTDLVFLLIVPWAEALVLVMPYKLCHAYCCSRFRRNSRDLSLQPLSTRRDISLLLLLHRFIHVVGLWLENLKKASSTSQRLHNTFSYTRVHGNTYAFNFSVLSHAIRLWNALPDDIASQSKHSVSSNRKFFFPASAV